MYYKTSNSRSKIRWLIFDGVFLDNRGRKEQCRNFKPVPICEYLKYLVNIMAAQKNLDFTT